MKWTDIWKIISDIVILELDGIPESDGICGRHNSGIPGIGRIDSGDGTDSRNVQHCGIGCILSSIGTLSCLFARCNDKLLRFIIRKYYFDDGGDRFNSLEIRRPSFCKWRRVTFSRRIYSTYAII
jgi:hypothetical protein